jgi:aspartate carbamoyltransferase catalytic subunit
MTSLSKSTFVLGHRHLLGIEGLSAADITGLLDLSEEYVELNRQIDKKRTSLRGRSSRLPPARSLRSRSRENGSAPTS